MEKTKKKFRIACYGVIAYAAISILELLVSFFRGIDCKVVFADISETYHTLALGLLIGAGILCALLHVVLAMWGLHKIKTRSVGLGHSILEFVLSVLAFFNLYSVIEQVFTTKDMVGTVIHLVVGVLWILSLAIYDWYALKFRRECLKG